MSKSIEQLKKERDVAQTALEEAIAISVNEDNSAALARASGLLGKCIIFGNRVAQVAKVDGTKLRLATVSPSERMIQIIEWRLTDAELVTADPGMYEHALDRVLELMPPYEDEVNNEKA